MKNLYLDRSHPLPAALLAAALCAAPGICAAQNIATFEFNEGPGASTVTSKDGRLIGAMGYAPDASKFPILTTDSPSGAAADKSIYLSGNFLVATDTATPVAAVQGGAFTIETWVKYDGQYDPVTPGGILGYGGTYKLGYRWSDGAGGSTIVLTAFGVADIDSGVLMPTDLLWHHLAVAFQPGTGVTFYLDGIVISTQAFTGSFLAPTSAYLTLGGERENNPFSGGLDRIRIHKKFLSESELDSVAATPKAPLADTVVAYNFNDTALPCQSSVNPALSAVSSEQHRANITRPKFVSDTPSGKSGDYALAFNRTTYILAPDVNSVIAMDQANPSFTMETWVKFGVQPIDRTVLLGYNGPGGAFTFSVTAQRHVFVTVLGVADIPSAAIVPDDGLWHHIAVVHESGKEMRFYIDGGLADTVAYAGGMIFDRTDTNLAIGCEPLIWSNYVGLMDRVRISKGVLASDKLDYLPVPGVVPGAPVLTSAAVQQITWPTFPAGYVLQSSPTLDPATAVWSAVSATSYQIGTNNTVYLPMNSSKMYYRLVKP